MGNDIDESDAFLRIASSEKAQSIGLVIHLREAELLKIEMWYLTGDRIGVLKVEPRIKMHIGYINALQTIRGCVCIHASFYYL